MPQPITELSSNEAIIVQLPKDIDATGWPSLRLQRLHLVNFAAHADVTLDLTHQDQILKVMALVGPNGSGKTTILNAIQLLFSNFSGYSQERIRIMMQKHLRNFLWLSPGEMLNAQLEVSGVFQCNGEEYTVRITRDGVVGQHPEFIQSRLIHYCFFARFDQELHLFQLKRQRWPLFQEIFSAVTGYPVEEDQAMFDSLSGDLRAKQLMEEYVTGFKVIKPRETIVHKQCSAGERKIAKCFSTILNKEVQPQIILIDNVTDHVELDRHLPVVANIEKCFPNSQVILTCHSVPVQRNLPHRERLVDMRLLNTTEAVRREPWRLRYYDEVRDALEKIGTMKEGANKRALEQDGEILANHILNGILQDPATAVADFGWKASFEALIQAQASSAPSKIINTH